MPPSPLNKNKSQPIPSHKGKGKGKAKAGSEKKTKSKKAKRKKAKGNSRQDEGRDLDGEGQKALSPSSVSDFVGVQVGLGIFCVSLFCVGGGGWVGGGLTLFLFLRSRLLSPPGSNVVSARE